MDGLLGRPLTRLFAFREDDDGGFPILDAIAARRPFEGQRAELRDDGRRLLLRGVPAFDGANAFIGYRGTATSLDAARPIATEAAGRPDDPDAFGQRLGSALRGPLDRIIAHADTIAARAEGPIRSDYAHYAVDIASAGRHLLALVGDLVDLQAIERPDFRVEAAPFDLAESVRHAVALLAAKAAGQGVRIDRPAADEPLSARGDGRRALQILVNLIGYAVRYSPPGGAVWLRWEREGGIIAVIVADQGKGIAPEDQVRIFEKFERVDPAEPGGTGLGLYIARRLARAMGGDIAIDSAAGQGARFIFTLPAA
jgi:signal transduction histidine kinase